MPASQNPGQGGSDHQGSQCGSQSATHHDKGLSQNQRRRSRMDPPDDDDGDDSPSDGDDSDPHANDSGFESAHSTSSAKLLREFRKRKWKEADEVKCLPLPTVPQFRAWKNVLYQNMNTASGRPDDKALAWARQAEDESLPDDYFHKSPKDLCHA